MKIRLTTVLVRVLLSLAAVAAVTFSCRTLLSVNPPTVGFAYLLVVLGVATAWGLVEAVCASVAAMLCYNFFFFPPVGQFTIADPENWVALFSFLVTALVASHLSDRAKRQTLEARRRQRATEQLYALSRAILLTETGRSIGAQSARHIAQIFECRAVALYDDATGELYHGGPAEIPAVDALLKQAVLQGSIPPGAAPGLLIAPVSLGGRPIGALALDGVALSDGALQALVNLVAIALERVRTEQTASRAEIARRSEEFKSTLLDAIAHEFKTPLTSIKAASTSILSGPASLPPELRELATVIDEETDRLSLLVSDAVRLSQIEAGKIRLDKQTVSVSGLLARVLQPFAPRLEGRPVRLDGAENLPGLSVDPDLVALALRQLVDNSLKYSPPDSLIHLSAAAEEDRVVIRVRDTGPGIPDRDRERVFDKFYRRDTARDSVPGTGLGLHIAREILRAHGGDLWVDSRPGAGSEFCAALPLAPEKVGA